MLAYSTPTPIDRYDFAEHFFPLQSKVQCRTNDSDRYLTLLSSTGWKKETTSNRIYGSYCRNKSRTKVSSTDDARSATTEAAAMAPSQSKIATILYKRKRHRCVLPESCNLEQALQHLEEKSHIRTQLRESERRGLDHESAKLQRGLGFAEGILDASLPAPRSQQIVSMESLQSHSECSSFVHGRVP